LLSIILKVAELIMTSLCKLDPYHVVYISFETENVF